MAKKTTPEKEMETAPEVEAVKKEVAANYEGGHDYISRLHKTKEDGEVKEEEEKS